MKNKSREKCLNIPKHGGVLALPNHINVCSSVGMLNKINGKVRQDWKNQFRDNRRY